MNRMILLFVILMNVDACAGWTPAVRISDECRAYDPRIVANGDTLHVVYWRSDIGDASYYLRSVDKGNTWAPPLYLADTTLSHSNAAVLIDAAQYNIVAIWYQILEGIRLNYGFRRSTDYGQSWGDISYILPSNYYQLEDHTFCISDSVIYLIYSHWDEEIIFEFMKSTDWGENWTESSEIFRADHVGPVDMAIRGDTLHFVWGGRFIFGEEWETYYIKSEDGGETWSGNILLSEADEYPSYWSVIAISPWGHLGVMWMDFKYSSHLWTGDLFIRYSWDSGDSWTEEEQLTFTHGAINPKMVWIGDSIHITWQDERYVHLDIYYMLSSNNGITWGEEQVVDDDPERSQTPAIAVSGENRYIVWGDRRPYVPGPGVYFSRWEPDVSVDETVQKPQNFNQQLRAYPNPFNDHTMIEFTASEPSEISIYNLLGRVIYSQIVPAGKDSFRWDAAGYSSGIYFYRLTSGDKTITKRMTLLK